jgi:hypothetical protein
MQTALAAILRGQTVHGSPVPVQLLVGIMGEVVCNEDGLNPWSKDRKFEHHVIKRVTSPLSGTDDNKSPTFELKAALTARDTVATVYALRTYVAAAMVASPEEIDGEKPLYSFGSGSSITL